MIDARTTEVLKETMRRESRSLLQYVGDAFPWTTREEQTALADLQRVVEEERQGAADIAALLLRQHQTPPYLGSYPMDFTTINYTSLGHLLPLLVEDERRSAAALERDLPGVSNPEALALLLTILEKKRAHVQALETLKAKLSPAPAAA